MDPLDGETILSRAGRGLRSGRSLPKRLLLRDRVRGRRKRNCEEGGLSREGRGLRTSWSLPNRLLLRDRARRGEARRPHAPEGASTRGTAAEHVTTHGANQEAGSSFTLIIYWQATVADKSHIRLAR